jgi:AcrR family transcriptional regulator
MGSEERPGEMPPGPAAASRAVHVPARRSARREITRQRVLDAAREVFAERGVIGGTVEDICERAGFTRGAFYSNFADKDDVLQALIAREHARLVEHLDAGFARLAEALGDGTVEGGGPAIAGVALPSGTGGEPAASPARSAGPGDADGADEIARGALMAAVADRLLRSVPDDRHFSLIQTELEIHAIRDPDTSRGFLAADAAFRARIADFLARGLRLLDRELVVDVADATDAVIAIVERGARRALLAGGSDPDALARTMLPAVILAASRPRG